MMRSFINISRGMLGAVMAAGLALCMSAAAMAAGIKVVPSASKVTPGEVFYADVVVENIPSEGLGAVQFRLNVEAPGAAVTGVADASQGAATDVAVSAPLVMGPAAAGRSGLGDFFWNGRGSHGILVMDNEALSSGSGLYAFGHTNGATPPVGSGTVARIYLGVGNNVAAEKITISLTDVALLDAGTVYALESNTGAVVDLKCYTTMPELVGMSRTEAEAALSAAKLLLGTVTELDNHGGAHALDKVLSQSANAGSTVLCDTAIDLAINTAPSDVQNAQAADKAEDETGTVVLVWTPSASADAAGYRVYNAAGARLAEITGASASGSEMTGLAIGQTAQLRVTAFDTHGNESAGVTVSVLATDDVAPRITISGVSDGAYYAATVQPVVSVQDANLAASAVTLNGAAYEMAPVSLDGAYTLTITATDSSENRTTREVWFVVDKTPPVITVNGVEKGRYYNADLVPVIVVTDANLDTMERLLNNEAYVIGTPIAAENNYELRVSAVDKAGNSAGDTWPFFIDKTKPVSSLVVSAPKYENAGSLYIGGTTAFTLAGTDAGTVVSGVNSIEYRSNEGAWSAYQAPFALSALPDGPVTMNYRAKDNATNVEDFRTVTMTLDATAPVTTLAIGAPKHVDSSGATFVTQNTVFTLSAADAFSGVAFTEYKVGQGPWTASAPFTVAAEGVHRILYYSKDNLDNLEADRTFDVTVDNTPPVTAAAIGTPKYTAPDGTLYVTSASQITLSATDNLSGVAVTEYRTDGGVWIPYAPFTLTAEGGRTIEYHSSDNVTNAENARILSAIVDNTPPATEIIVGQPKYTAADGKLYVTAASQFTLSAADAGSGVALTEYRIDNGAWTAYAPFSLQAEGAHTIGFRSSDNVTNTEVEHALLVIVDSTPPATTLTIGDPKHTDASGTIFGTQGTVFTLTAADNLSAVASTEYRIDNGAWTAYAQFTIASEGTHTISYRSRDNVGNVEADNALTVVIDNTPPDTTITAGTPQYTSASGKLYARNDTAFTLTAVDNLSGVALTEYRIDGSAWTAYTAFTIPAEGEHTIEYRSRDNVTNFENTKTLAVTIDNAPPVTTITVNEPKYTATGGSLFVTRASQFTLSATDNLSGVARTEYRLDSGPWTAYAPFSIATEGEHTIRYRSTDNVTNTESEKTLIVIVDNTPPSSTIAVGAPQYSSDGKLFISGGTMITLTASDALSGVKKIEYGVDGGGWTVYSGAFTISAFAEGEHRIRYHSTDNVGNEEDVKELAVVLDKTPPVTSISASDPLLGGIVNAVSPKTLFILAATDNLAGVKTISYKIDDGPWQTYYDGFALAALAAGQHTVAYRAVDNVLNEEAIKTVAVRLIVMEVEKKLAADTAVLVGVWSDKFDKVQKDLDIERLDAILSSLKITYTIARNMDEFTAALRSGRYTTYLLIDVKEPVVGEEIREAVQYGDGLIFIKTRPDADPFLDDVFGLAFTGKSTGSDLMVNLVESPISNEGTIQASGKNVVASLTNGTALTLGMVTDNGAVYPAIVFNQYGRGRTILYAFDLLASPGQAQAAALLINSLNHVRPLEHYVRAQDGAPIRIRLDNSSEQIDVKLTETLPAGSTADAITPQAAYRDGVITWQKTLGANERTTFGYYLNLPDLAGEYVTDTELRYRNGGEYRLYGNYSLRLTVNYGSKELWQSVIADLLVMTPANNADAAKITDAVDVLYQINTEVANEKQALQNIKAILSAVDKVRSLSVDTAALRLKIDELLKVWEKKWYLMEN